MLILSRTNGESIMIGDDARVAVSNVEVDRTLLVISERKSSNAGGFHQTASHWMKSGEAIGVADQVICSVMMIDRGRVRLGFKCPKTIKINRTEIYGLSQRKE